MFTVNAPANTVTRRTAGVCACASSICGSVVRIVRTGGDDADKTMGLVG